MHQHVVGYSLIDISQTSALQLQNYNTLLQTIALRGNPLNIKVSMAGNQDMQDYDFGDDFGGHHNIWVISFVTEQLEVFGNKHGALGGLGTRLPPSASDHKLNGISCHQRLVCLMLRTQKPKTCTLTSRTYKH